MLLFSGLMPQLNQAQYIFFKLPPYGVMFNELVKPVLMTLILIGLVALC